MKEVIVQTYKFSELSDDAKKKAIEEHWNVLSFFEWWDFIYDDAKRLGLKINAFDLYPKSIDITYQDDPEDVANAILKEYGHSMDIHNTATEYLARYNQIEQLVEEDEILPSDELEQLNEDFLHDLGECFLSLLNSEYEWRTSDEAIGEELEINDYDFTADGNRFNY